MKRTLGGLGLFLAISLSVPAVAAAAVVPPPTNMETVCSADGLSLTFSWTAPAGYDTFYTRGTRDGVNIPEAWNENYVGTSKTISVAPGYEYDVWVHTKAADGSWSDALLGDNVVCDPAPKAPVAQLSNSSIATNWLVKDICVDSRSRPVVSDPYYDCPSGTTRRKIRVGDPLPYHNIDQTRAQQNDSFPIYDDKRNTLYFHTFDYAPFNEFNTYDNADGYDVHAIRDGYVSYSNTADGGGFRTTFFGQNCTYGSGWVSFPEKNFLTGGSKSIPVSGVYWEQAGQPYPGDCPPAYANSLTTWKLQPTQFGGISGNPIKTMNAMVSWHGYDTSSYFTEKGHLEVFYYTQQYGLTKWEVWRPIEQGAKKTTTCKVPDTVTYEGRQFVVEHCRDWSAVVPATKAEIPVWPVGNANMLKYWHFNDGGFLDSTTPTTGKWQRYGTSPAGNLINWAALNSQSLIDMKYASTGPGLRYLAVNCGAGADGKCGAGGSQAIYQDLPASSFKNNTTYFYGITGRTESGEGKLQVAIQVISSSNQVLWQHVTEGTLLPLHGTTPLPGAAESKFLSSKVVGSTVNVPISRSAAKVRFLILPITPHTFDIVDAFVNPYPTRKGSLSSVSGVAQSSIESTLAAVQRTLNALASALR